MKKTVFVWGIVVAMLGLVACANSAGTMANPATPTSSDSLEQIIRAQEQATRAAFDLQQRASRATTIADATREAMVIQAQQTRLIQDAGATKTAQAAIATVNALNANATRIAQEATATVNALNVQATQVSASATATANAANAQATRMSASATDTAVENNIQQTRIAGNATATVVRANVIVEEEKATWNQRLEALRALASFIGVLALLVGVCVLVGFGAIRFIDAGVLRARVFRDKTGTVFVIGEKDKAGRQMVLVPGRSPGAALAIAPPGIKPELAEPQAIDEETTKRDQAISLMIAATGGKGDGEEAMAQLTDGDAVRFVDEPPAQLVEDETKLLIDGEWGKEITR